MTWDNKCNEVIRKNINQTIAWYLMASYAYYKEDNPILTDDTYDKLGRMINEFWDKIQHIHKDNINRGDLEAGTFLGEYPSRIPGAVAALRKTEGDQTQ